MRGGPKRPRRAMRTFAVLCAGVLLALATLLAPAPLAAQAGADKAVLVADRVALEGRERLVAEGGVEVFYQGRRLRARRVVYDRAAERLSIEGPITLTDGPDTVILADAAALDADLRNGILRGARLVMDQQLQLAAVQLARVDGRYSQLYKAAVTSCRVCGQTEDPLWQIRAKSVIHDREERQLYFDEAQFLIYGVPVIYLPRLRLPDPTLERTTGFLIPSIRNNSELGTGLKIPYFITLGDSRDLTLTPYLSSETRTLELRYRQAFRQGSIEIEGAVSQDTLYDDGARAYVFADGSFALPRDFSLSFDIEAVTDDTYLVDYGYSDKDRLDSEVTVFRARRDEFIRGAVVNYHSLRPGEDNATLPTIIADANYERRYFPRALGGELRLGVNAHAHYRYSDLSTDGSDADPWADGLDLSRLNAEASWRRSDTLAYGLRSTLTAALAVDAFRVNQGGSTALASAAQLTPSAAATLRWPLVRRDAQSGRQVIEPMAQLSWTGGSNLFVPNEESTRVEFDEGNLLSLSRFPAPDRRERGLAAALGARWTQISPSGLTGTLVMGQVFREDPARDLSQSSGLSGLRSDLLIAGQIRSPRGLSLTARGIFDDGFDITKAGVRGGWRGSRGGLEASYVWLGADTAEERPATVSEWSLDGDYRLSRHWIGSASWRYDVASDRTASAGVGLQYRNECVEVELALSRRFTSSSALDPSTEVAFTVALRGFSVSDGDRSYTRTCNK